MIIYKGYRIAKTGICFCVLGLIFTSLNKAKKAVDSTIRQKESGLY